MMSAIAFALYFVICSSTGCTELQAASGLTHLDCLIAGAQAVERGDADRFVCRFEQGQEA